MWRRKQYHAELEACGTDLQKVFAQIVHLPQPVLLLNFKICMGD